MDECRLVREDVEYAISLIEHRPEQDTVDYKVFDVLNEAHEQLKKMEELLKKQEPMKPRSVSRHGAYPQIQHYCGACNAFLPRHKQEFCSVCGQAVKWEG